MLPNRLNSGFTLAPTKFGLAASGPVSTCVTEPQMCYRLTPEHLWSYFRHPHFLYSGHWHKSRAQKYLLLPKMFVLIIPKCYYPWQITRCQTPKLYSSNHNIYLFVFPSYSFVQQKATFSSCNFLFKLIYFLEFFSIKCATLLKRWYLHHYEFWILGGISLPDLSVLCCLI